MGGTEAIPPLSSVSSIQNLTSKTPNQKSGQFFPIDIQQKLEGKEETLDLRIACFPEVIAKVRRVKEWLALPD